MKVQEKFLQQIPVDSVAGISAANLLGDKFLNITKGRAAETVKDGAELKSLQAQDIPELMAQSANLLQTFQTIVNRLDALLAGVEQGKGNIGKLLKDEELYDRLNGIATEGQNLLSDVRKGQGTISKLIYDDALYQEIRSPIKRVDALLADLQAGNGSAGKLLKDPGLYDEAKASLGEIRGLLADLNSGKGSAGKLLKDDALHKRLEELVGQVQQHHRQDQLRTGHAGPIGGQPAVVRLAERRDPRIPVAGQRYAGQPQEVPDDPADAVLIARKQLVVNADDFGFTPDVNAGIVEAHRKGILTATTLMANGDAFADAVRLARETPTLDIGCHLVLIGGQSLVTKKAFPATAAQLVAALATGRIRVYDELAAQIRRIVDAGLRPTHLDTHKHTHLAPPVLDAVARLAEDFDIRWVRRPFDFPLQALRGGVPRVKRLTSDALGMLRRRFHRVLERHGCRTTDHFAGFQITGRFRTAELVELMAEIPRGQHGADGPSGALRPGTARGAHAAEREP